MKLISGFKILNKHKMQAFLMIILSGLLFSLFGSVLNSNNKQKKSRKSFYIVILMTLQMKTITLNVNIKKQLAFPTIPLT